MEEISTEYLKNFYNNWYDKTKDEIEYDIRASVEKCEVAGRILKQANIGKITSVLEAGCGYGRNLVEIKRYANADFGVGFDVCEKAITFAKNNYEDTSTMFMHIPSMDIEASVLQIQQKYNHPFDIVILFDLIEHIPKPKALVRALSKIAKYFLIILPLDNTIFNNYILPQKMKKYPGAFHPDGHLREFHVNNVHPFIASLGLAPIIYDFHIWSLDDMYPSHIRKTLKGKISYRGMRLMNGITRKILTKRIFLRLIGNGFFICLAKWHSEWVLDDTV